MRAHLAADGSATGGPTTRDARTGDPTAGHPSTSVDAGERQLIDLNELEAADRHTAASADRQRLIGDRLRRIRHQQRLSLADVEHRSGGEWKAVVVGAYERGDRAITVARLARLADFYGVPLADLLPAPHTDAPHGGASRLVLDLTRLEPDGSPGMAAVVRFAERIQRLRGDHNGRVLTLRGADVQTIALAVGEDPDELVDGLRTRGALLNV
jgi:transcriptional regulator with XRE-family HTH domain